MCKIIIARMQHAMVPSPRSSLSPRHKRHFSHHALIWPSFCVLAMIIGHFHGMYWGDVVVVSDMAIHTTATRPYSHHQDEVDGWRHVNIFVGMDTSNDGDTKQQTWYSQAAQDELVYGLLRNQTQGYFVDLAANDAHQFSNTAALEQKGWKGLCIEPNPIYWHNLTQFRTCKVVAAVVGEKRNSPVYFRYNARDHGGIADHGFDNGKRWQSHSEKAYTVPLQEIFDLSRVPHDIDYLSLDVEGAESFIMLQFPLSKYRIKVITAERLKGEIRQYLKDHGYQFVRRLTRWGESLWVHESVKDSLDWSTMDRLDFPRG